MVWFRAGLARSSCPKMVTFGPFLNRKGGVGEGSSGGAPASPLASYIFFPPSSFKPKASCIRSLRNPNPRNISVLVTLSDNSKAEFGTTFMLAWPGHFGVQQSPAGFSASHSFSQGLCFRSCCEQAEESQTFRERGDDTAFLRTNDILTYIM